MKPKPTLPPKVQRRARKGWSWSLWCLLLADECHEYVAWYLGDQTRIGWTTFSGGCFLLVNLVSGKCETLCTQLITQPVEELVRLSANVDHRWPACPTKGYKPFAR